MRQETEVCEFRVEGQDSTLEWRCCYYCGAVANTLDHVPPRAVRDLMLSDPAAFGKYDFKEVDCCAECNSALGKQLWTLKERKRYIAGWLKKRYHKLLEIPDWTEKELNTLAQRLREKVVASLRLRNIVRARLRWAKAV